MKSYGNNFNHRVSERLFLGWCYFWFPNRWALGIEVEALPLHSHHATWRGLRLKAQILGLTLGLHADWRSR